MLAKNRAKCLSLVFLFRLWCWLLRRLHLEHVRYHFLEREGNVWDRLRACYFLRWLHFVGHLQTPILLLVRPSKGIPVRLLMAPVVLNWALAEYRVDRVR